MSELFAPVVSITSTKRRRFFWAAWTSGAPTRVPFRRPDLADGGAATFEEAKRIAEERTGHALGTVDPLWARAVLRLLRGEPLWPSRASREPAARAPAAAAPGAAPAGSVWAILGVAGHEVSAEELKAAYRRKVLETHPDQGGTEAAFQAVVRAYAEASARLRRPRRR